MADPAFGRLARVDLRTAWKREDTEFTPWLGEQDNLRLLGETVGVELELEAQEASVGPFRADLLCKDANDGSLVLIENQIERTDHTHLGQVLTYAAGLDAVTVIWIAARFTDEHRAALDWLNDVSRENIRFFGLEVELWRIGESPVAPKFNVVARPNDWSKTIRTAAGTGGASSEHQQLRYEFWSGFLAHLEDVGSAMSSNRTPSREYWMNWGIGRTHCSLTGLVGFRDGWIAAAVNLNGDDATAYFHLLQEEREAIESECGRRLVWDHVAGRKQSLIKFEDRDVDPKDRESWPALYSWLGDAMDTADRVFRKRVAELDASDWAGG